MVSRGSEVKPPMSTMARNGIQPHTSANTHTVNANAGLDNHDTSANGGNSTPKNASNKPNSGLNINRNDTPTNAGLIANGNTNNARAVTRSRPPGANNNAMPSAQTTDNATVATVYTVVTHAAFQNAGSSNTAHA